MAPLLILLAQVAAQQALSSGQQYMQGRAQDKADRKNASSSGIAAAQQSLTGQPALLPQARQQAGMTPFDYTGLDEQMQQQLFNQIFKGILSPKGTTP